ncbi:C-C motif chemokine 3-like [Struthio camelus]|uniref:C-C motif chemokine 3-like n=1 Tax=Struthio camelus TaxID=8801 RepID=UPI003604095B
MRSFSFCETLCPPSGSAIRGGQGPGAEQRAEESSLAAAVALLQVLSPSSTMKVSVAALAALLLAALCSPAATHLDGVPVSCCFSYQRKPIPRGLVVSAYVTTSSCAQPGVIFVTKKQRELCADPQAAWVQAHLKHFLPKPN